MKRLHIIFLFFVTALVFQSCSTDVDLFADGEEYTIVYAMLNPSLDTNYVKITKSFTGNANENALNYDLSNYDYKLDVRLINKRHNDTIILDTVSVYKPYDPNTPFYSDCQQLYYYTTHKLQDGDTYQLIIKKKDGSIISSEVKVISEFVFASYLYNQISFESNVSNVSNQIRWRYNDINNATYAAYYEVIGYFHYKQVNPGSTDTLDYSMTWNMGNGTYQELITDIYLHTTHIPVDFYDQLRSDQNIKNNSPQGVKRYFGNFEVVITAAGKELYDYLLANNSSSAIQDTPEYSNIENGIGLMSSRFILSKNFTINPLTRRNLADNYPEWGFVYIPDPEW